MGELVVPEKTLQPEIAPHKKKSRTASKSNSSKRSDHKHDYEKVILESWFGFEWGKRCTICGRIDSGPFNFSTSSRFDFMKPETTKKPGISFRDYLTIAEIKEKFPGVPIYKYDKSVRHGWRTYKEVEEKP